MHLLTALHSFMILFGSINSPTPEAEQVNFRVQVYPYSGYYSYPPYCPPGYSYGPSYGYGGRGFSFSFGQGSRYGRRCYPYYGNRKYYGRRNYYYRRSPRRHKR